MKKKSPCFPAQTFWLGRVSYEEGLKIQEARVEAVQSGGQGDCLLLLEHEPVYTIGRTRDQSSLKDAENLPYPVHQINRGGQATYHGPGQLVGYPILDLNKYGRDLHRYLRFLEETLVVFSKTYEVPADQREGLTGVWVENRKLASIGVGVRKWVSMHGFAINVENRLDGFQSITPCGLAQVEMTALERESQQQISVVEAAASYAEIFWNSLPELAIA